MERSWARWIQERVAEVFTYDRRFERLSPTFAFLRNMTSDQIPWFISLLSQHNTPLHAMKVFAILEADIYRVTRAESVARSNCSLYLFSPWQTKLKTR